MIFKEEDDMWKNCKEILDYHEDYIKKWLGDHDDMGSMIIFGKDDNIRVVQVCVEDKDESRKSIKMVMELVSKIGKPDFLVFISEAYTVAFEKMSNTPEEAIREYQEMIRKYGSLENLFKQGDKRVKEIVTIQSYMPSEKLMRVLDKKNLKPMIPDGDVSEFGGFLSVSDIDRVFWGKK
jgi:aromatic ring-opening dioxygenase catalytic subunit (LigB family)